MSFSEMLAELPRLTHEERRLLCRRALALDAEAGAEIDALEFSVNDGFTQLDRLEDEDRKRGEPR